MAFVFQASSGLFKRSSDKAGGMTGYKVFVLSTTLQVLDTDARAPLVVSATHKGPRCPHQATPFSAQLTRLC